MRKNEGGGKWGPDTTEQPEATSSAGNHSPGHRAVRESRAAAVTRPDSGSPFPLPRVGRAAGGPCGLTPALTPARAHGPSGLGLGPAPGDTTHSGLRVHGSCFQPLRGGWCVAE